MPIDISVDVLIIGGGPSGAISAMHLLGHGIRPLIVERQQFPRYHIGESMTGECALILHELGFEERMLAAGHPVKYGGLVFGSRGNGDWWVPVMRRTPDLDLHNQTAWQVRRSGFDTMLLDEAVHRGADLLQGRAVAPRMSEDGATVSGVTVRTDDGSEIDIDARMTLDCSGQATFLANQGVTGPKYLGAYDKQIAVFSQVADYVRDHGKERADQPGNTHIFYKGKHHWAWAIPLDDDITSIGIVVPAQYFRDRKEPKADFIRRELGDLNVGLAARTPQRELVEEPHVIPNYSYQVRRFAGPGFICVGDAHRFVDPIFSFGMYVAMKEAGLAANAARGYLTNGAGRHGENPFREHMIHAESAIDRLEDMIDTFWENPLAFAVFAQQRYREAIIDLFAGRIYEGMPAKGLDRSLAAFRKLLQRERCYTDDDLLSVPIGSRFQPDRAPLWNAELDSVETTERWIREQL